MQVAEKVVRGDGMQSPRRKCGVREVLDIVRDYRFSSPSNRRRDDMAVIRIRQTIDDGNEWFIFRYQCILECSAHSGGTGFGPVHRHFSPRHRDDRSLHFSEDFPAPERKVDFVLGEGQQEISFGDGHDRARVEHHPKSGHALLPTPSLARSLKCSLQRVRGKIVESEFLCIVHELLERLRPNHSLPSLVIEYVLDAQPPVSTAGRTFERNLAFVEQADESRSADAQQVCGSLGREHLPDGGDHHRSSMAHGIDDINQGSIDLEWKRHLLTVGPEKNRRFFVLLEKTGQIQKLIEVVRRQHRLTGGLITGNGSHDPRVSDIRKIRKVYFR